MTSEEIKAEAREYANKIISLAVSMYNPAAETIAAQAYEDGIKKGLKQHEHDYLVKTADLKKKYEKQKEINKELVDDIAALQRGKADLIFVRDQKAKHINELKDQLTKAKEIIKEFVRLEYADFTNGDYSNELSKVLKQAEQFLNSEVEK